MRSERRGRNTRTSSGPAAKRCAKETAIDGVRGPGAAAIIVVRMNEGDLRQGRTVLKETARTCRAGRRLMLAAGLLRLICRWTGRGKAAIDADILRRIARCGFFLQLLLLLCFLVLLRCKFKGCEY